MQTIVSPCTSICRLDAESGLCIGCYRTMDEIGSWSSLTPAQRRAVLDQVAKRRPDQSGPGTV